MCILMVLCIIILITYACFDINSIQLDSFIMGMNENSKNIHVSYDVTPEERKNLRKEKRKKKREIKVVFS